VTRPAWTNRSHLLTNACKFTDRGGRVALFLDLEGDQAVIRVRDNGIGIAAEHLPRIFEMFRQIDSARDRSGGRVGVGLALVRKLLEMDSGNVEAISSGLGSGSEFVVRLPILETPEIPVLSDLVEFPTGSPRRVLIVDDNIARPSSRWLRCTSRNPDVARTS
jgi:hypothetical protein